MLTVEALSKRTGDFSLRDISFHVDPGDYFVLLGASGAGKTLLLEILAGIEPPDAGQIRLAHQDITRAKIQHRGFGLVYQDQALFPHMTVFANIAYGLRARRMPHAQLREKVHALAAQTGAASLLDRIPASLSGGEAQRVALARALATDPRCLLLDEPIASLDVQARAQMRALLRALHRNGQTVIHVTHDYEEALSLATRVAIIERGAIVQTGAPHDVFQHPATEFAARFAGIRNVYRGNLQPAPPNHTPHFTIKHLAFSVLTDAAPGPGCLIIRAEDITVSLNPPDTSAQNTFPGIITDLAPIRLGIELTLDIGVEITARVTHESAGHLGLTLGKKVWISFKATAARFIED